MNAKEKILIEIMKVNTKDMAVLYLESYIQENGFLSDEATKEVRKILEGNVWTSKKS